MQLYSCKVRLSGSLYNEVFKPEVTIPEIAILRHLHGDDAVAEIKSLGRDAFDTHLDDEGKPHKTLRTDKAERERLRILYDPNDRFLTKEVFGVNQPMPQVLDGVDNAVVPEQPARRSRRVKEASALAEMVT